MRRTSGGTGSCGSASRETAQDGHGWYDKIILHDTIMPIGKGLPGGRNSETHIQPPGRARKVYRSPGGFRRLRIRERSRSRWLARVARARCGCGALAARRGRPRLRCHEEGSFARHSSLQGVRAHPRPACQASEGAATWKSVRSSSRPKPWATSRAFTTTLQRHQAPFGHCAISNESRRTDWDSIWPPGAVPPATTSAPASGWSASNGA